MFSDLIIISTLVGFICFLFVCKIENIVWYKPKKEFHFGFNIFITILLSILSPLSIYYLLNSIYHFYFKKIKLNEKYYEYENGIEKTIYKIDVGNIPLKKIPKYLNKFTNKIKKNNYV